MTINSCWLGARIFILFLWVLFSGAAISADTLPQKPGYWITPEVHYPGLQQEFLESSAAKVRVSYFVYTPPEYSSDSAVRYPVLYWLHGSDGGVRHVVPLVKRFDDAIKAARIPAMIVVFPNGLKESMWSDSSDGQFPVETVLIDELIPHVDRTFRTRADRRGRLVEGFSMGGYGAARLAFKYPEMFGAVSILAGGPLQADFDVENTPRGDIHKARALFKRVWGNEQALFKIQSPRHLAEINVRPVRKDTLIRLVVGDRDELMQSNVQFCEHLDALKITHQCIVLSEIAHDPYRLIKASEENSWRFYRTAFGMPSAE
jgi:esterase/lipase superfamily enzyme